MTAVRYNIAHGIVRCLTALLIFCSLEDGVSKEVHSVIVRFLIPILITFAFAFFLYKNEKSNAKELVKNLCESCVVLRLPKMYFWLGATGCVFLTILFVLCSSPKIELVIWSYVAFLFLGSIFMSLLLSERLWKVEVFKDENYFIYRTSFGRKYKVSYNECIAYKNATNMFVIKTQRKTFYVDIHSRNFGFLASRVEHAVNTRR